MKILITGGTGFVGSNLAKAFPQDELLVTGVNVEAEIPANARLLNTHLNGVNWNLLENVDIVFHQAANNDTQCKDAVEMDRANYWAGVELFNRLYEKGCRKFVYASSTAVYGNSPPPYSEFRTPLNPLTPYAESKAVFDRFAMLFGQNKGCSVIGLRYCNIYGPGEFHKGKRSSMVYQIIKTMMAGKSPKLFADGTQRRDWCYIEDVVALNLLASNYSSYGIFNCGSGKAFSFREIVQYTNEILGTRIEPEWIENPIKATYQDFTLCDITKARNFLGYRPQYDLRLGIAKYIEHLSK